MTYSPKSGESWRDRKRRERGERAVERQLAYQENKSRTIPDDQRRILLEVKSRAVRLRSRLNEFREASADDKVLEVGSGAHGLIFGFDDVVAIGVDPLAVEYKDLFPTWQHETETIAAVGEELPFGNNTFDLVMSDNVVDHAANPVGIIQELIRVLSPGGTLYFSVNTHHPVYQAASVLHGWWNAAGVKLEIGPFADHTVHFTEKKVKTIFQNLPVEILHMSEPFRRKAIDTKPRGGIENTIKRMFHKNTLFEVIAKKN